MHAVVGLDRNRRQDVLSLLRARLGDRQLAIPTRMVCIRLANELDVDDQAFINEEVSFLLETIAMPTDKACRLECAFQLFLWADRLDKDNTAKAARVVAQEIDKINLDDRLFVLQSSGLFVRAAGLDPMHAFCLALEKLLENTDEKTAAVVARMLIVKMQTYKSLPWGKVGPDDEYHRIGELLRKAADRLDESGAADIAQFLLRQTDQKAVNDQRLGHGNVYFHSALAAMTGKMNEATASEFANQLVYDMGSNPPNSMLDVEWLSRAVSRMRDREAYKVGNKATEVMLSHLIDDKPISGFGAITWLAANLKILAVYLDKEMSKDVLLKIVKKIGVCENPDVQLRQTGECRSLIEFLEVMAERLDQDGAVAVAETIVETMKSLDKQDDLHSSVWKLVILAEAHRAVVVKMRDKEARKAAEAVAPLINKAVGKADLQALESAAEAIELVVRRLDKETAKDVAHLLLQAMAAPGSGGKRWPALAEALKAVADKLSEAEARKAAAAAAQMIVRAIPDPDPWVSVDRGPLVEYAKAMKAVAEKLDEEGAAATAQIILQAMSNTRSGLGRQIRAEVLKVVAGKMRDVEARRVYVEARRVTKADAKQILQAMETVANACRPLGQAEGPPPMPGMKDPDNVSKLDRRPDPPSPAPMRPDPSPEALPRDELSNLNRLWQHAAALNGVRGITGDAEETNAAARIILQAMSKYTDAQAAVAIGVGQSIIERKTITLFAVPLQALAGEVDDETARAVAEAVGQVVIQMKGDVESQLIFASVLEAMAENLDDAEANKGASLAARVLLRAMALDSIPTSYSAVMDAQMLREQIVSGKALGPSLGRTPSFALLPRLNRITAKLHRQELLELLKRPECTGAARAALLDRLGQTANRKFRNLWELVDWLEKNDPSIDVVTPPVGPAP
jgi:hypothetical protein